MWLSVDAYKQLQLCLVQTITHARMTIVYIQGVPKQMPSTQFCGAAILIGVQGVNCYTEQKPTILALLFEIWQS